MERVGALVNEHVMERKRMVERQLRPRGIRDERVLAAMYAVPRHRFVPDYLGASSYEDCAWPIGGGQVISAPYLVARTCELAEASPSDRVLLVGERVGYHAAVLARLCNRVVGIELIEALVPSESVALAQLGICNVVLVGGEAGHAPVSQAPYQAIIVTAALPEAPATLLAQLSPGGRLVVPLGNDFVQRLSVLRKGESGIDMAEHERCSSVPMRPRSA